MSDPMHDIMEKYYNLEKRTAKEIIEWIHRHKEEITVAFIAKYGYDPDQVEIIQEPTRWYIRRKQ